MKINFEKFRIEDITKRDLLIISSIVFLVVLILGMRALSLEDEWICEKGVWVAHGKPDSPKPIVECNENSVQTMADETYCQKDSDCACGGHINTGNCFLGNKSFIDAGKQCSKMCPEGTKLVCIKNKCQLEENVSVMN